MSCRATGWRIREATDGNNVRCSARGLIAGKRIVVVGVRTTQGQTLHWLLAILDYAIPRVLRVYPLFMAIAIMISLSSDEHKKHMCLLLIVNLSVTMVRVLQSRSHSNSFSLHPTWASMLQAQNLNIRIHTKCDDELKKEGIQVDDPSEDVKKLKVEKEQIGSPKVLFHNGIRGVAAMLVVCQRIGYLAGREIGAHGVHTFFVLSALLSTMILEKKFASLHSEQTPPKRWLLALIDYSTRRILRVYPLFLAVIWDISMSSDKRKKQWWWVRHLGKDYSAYNILTFQSDCRYYVLWSLPVKLKYYWLIPVSTGGIVALRKWWCCQ